MSSNFLPPKLKLNPEINEKIVNLLENIKTSNSPMKLKSLLLSFYQQNPEIPELINSYNLLGFEPNNNSFKIPLNKKKVIEILTNEFQLQGPENELAGGEPEEITPLSNIIFEKNMEENDGPGKNRLGRRRKRPKFGLENDETNKIGNKDDDNNEYSYSSDNSPQNNQLLNESETQNVISVSKNNTKSNTRNTAFGLKEISKRVMEIIKHNGQTTYREISDQIVNEINEKSIKDEKNIRRRIYDSLNVMKSMKLFKKDKKDKTIRWNYEQEFDPLNENEDREDDTQKPNNDEKIDYKNNSNLITELKKENKDKKEKIALLTQELKGLKNVLERNRRDNEIIAENKKIYFPFLMIEFPTNKDPKVNVALNEEKTSAHIGFDEADGLYGDLDCVSKIGNQPNFQKDT